MTRLGTSSKPRDLHGTFERHTRVVLEGMCFGGFFVGCDALSRCFERRVVTNGRGRGRVARVARVENRPAGRPANRLAGTGLLVLFAASVGCGSYDSLRRDLHAMQRYAEVLGEVDVPSWSGAPLVVAAFAAPSEGEDRFRRVEVQELTRPGSFRFRLPPGDYSFCVYEDRDGDHVHSADEPFGVWRRFEPTTLDAAARVPLRLVAAERGAGPPERPARDGRVMQVGSRASLDEPRFDALHGRLGVWEPRAFVAARAFGLFVVEDESDDVVGDANGGMDGVPPEPGMRSSVRVGVSGGAHDDREAAARSVPVVFVHGILGHASEFREAIAGLDRSRFEPWVFQYPSGLPLAEQAARFADALREMRSRARAKQVCVVAHSMGGLVSRAMLKQLASTDEDAPEIPLFVTLASPLAGHAGAAAGVAMAPVVVPSWVDLAPDSDFLGSLYEPALPERTRYALFFAFAGSAAWSGAPGDGVVTLESQLRREAQAEAEWVRGFATEHAAIVRDRAALDALNELLAAECRAGDGE